MKKPDFDYLAALVKGANDCEYAIRNDSDEAKEKMKRYCFDRYNEAKTTMDEILAFLNKNSALFLSFDVHRAGGRDDGENRYSVRANRQNGFSGENYGCSWWVTHGGVQLKGKDDSTLIKEIVVQGYTGMSCWLANLAHLTRGSDYSAEKWVEIKKDVDQYVRIVEATAEAVTKMMKDITEAHLSRLIKVNKTAADCEERKPVVEKVTITYVKVG